ncbi:MAG: leucine-rich repeat domain-containing protein [Metamycoplasmataceae bacterium]
MKLNKKLLPIGLLSTSIIPFAMVSCNSGEKVTTYFESEGFKISSEGEIMGFSNTSLLPAGAINIKESYNGVTVTRIADDAFKGQINISEVILPPTLVSIGSNAFFDVGSPVKLPEQNTPDPIIWDLSHLVNLKEIGDGAFGKTEPSVSDPAPTPEWFINLKLENLTNLERIGIGSFSNRNIYRVDFPIVSKIKVIDKKAFGFNKITSIKIPDSLTTIGEYAFENNKLTKIDIPRSITSIGGGAFIRNQLILINIPDSVTTIGVHAFGYNKLTSIIIPSSIKIIEYGTFSSNKLTSIDIPNSVTSIGEYSFGFNPLASITIPDSVKNICDNAFANNKFTDNAMITLPAKFNTASERKRIGIELAPLKENELNNKPKLEAPLVESKRKKENIQK